MEFALILLILGFALLVYLIFKFIKKIVFAIFSVVLLVVLIIGGVIGLVYLDYNYITSQNDIDVKLIYADGENYLVGATIPVKNQSMIVEEVSGISKTQLNDLDVEEIDEDSKQIVVVMDKGLYAEVLTQESYSVPDLDSPEFEGYDLTLTRDEVLLILDSSDALSEFLNIMYEKNDVDPLMREISEPVVREMIESELEKRDMTFKQLVFLTALTQSLEDQKNLVTVIEGFKNEELNVYPERFTYKLLRMLPVDTIKSYVPDFQE